MIKLIKSFFFIFLFLSCGGDASKRILIEGIPITELNVRSAPTSANDRNIVDVLDAGDIVSIIAFDEGYDAAGFSWCKIKLDRPRSFEGNKITTAWIAYKTKDLPFIVSIESYDKIKRMYEMEYESEPNEIIKGARFWLTQAIYDFTYEDYLQDIKKEFDLRDPRDRYDEAEESDKKYGFESPNYSVDYSASNRYPQYCRTRISTASRDREEEALYAVIFNQSPRTIHFFKRDKRSNRGSFMKSFDFSNRLKSNIKSIQRRTYKTKVYIKDDYYGYKERLPLSYDAIRLRPQRGRERYIVHNNNDYTSSNLNNLYNLYVKEEY